MQLIPWTHKELVEKAFDLLRKKCVLTVTEIASYAGEQPDVIGWLNSNKGAVLIECKASKSDFRNDFKKFYRIYPEKGLGRYRYYLAPIGMIHPEQLPDNWGLIEVKDDGNCRTRIKAKSQHCDLLSEREVMISVIRRIGENSPIGISAKVYTNQTKCRTKVAIEDL